MVMNFTRSPMMGAALAMAAIGAASMAGGRVAVVDRRAPLEPPDDEAFPDPETATVNTDKLEHVRLVRQNDKIANAAQVAADRAHKEGGSPAVQLRAARAASHQALRYLPHQGMKERQRRLKRLAQAAGDVAGG